MQFKLHFDSLNNKRKQELYKYNEIFHLFYRAMHICHPKVYFSIESCSSICILLSEQIKTNRKILQEFRALLFDGSSSKEPHF